MSRRRDEDRYSRYDGDKSRRMRSRSRGRDASEEGNDLWDAQFMEPASYPRAPPAPTFTHEVGPSYSNSYTSYSGIYDDFPSVGGASIPAAPQPPSIQWNQHMLPPAPEPAAIPAPAPPQQILEEQMKKEEAIESEVRNQRATLAKQREEYTRKSAILKKELETLKDQRNELRGDSKRSPSPDSKRFLKENAKLQLEIQNKLKTINNVVDMLNGIIGENRGELIVKKHESEPESSPERRATKRKSRSPSAKDRKFNYVYYDPEMHWCRICNEFPATAKDYLNHLHSAQHHKIAAAHLEAPWHGKPNSNEGLPNYPNSATKRTPIRGLQFFVPSTAWYCKLCDDWIGDLHCASAHLKSLAHSKNYTNFVEQNPHWETDWMSDRQKAFEKSRSSDRLGGAVKPAIKQEDKQLYTAHTITFDKDGFTKKKKEKSASPSTPDKSTDKKKDKKKQKRRIRSRSTSSSSDSERERKKEKKAKKMRESKDKEENDTRDEKLIEQWMQCEKLTEKERKMLENLQNSIQRAKGKERREPPRDRQRERERERERERIAHVTQSKRQDSREEREKREDRERENAREMRGGGDKMETKETSHNENNADKKQNEPKKMPFIGKMPVFKSLSKTLKVEEQKESEQKKQDDEVAKKKRQVIDAEIQRKVAEFKLKMQTKMEVGPPGVALPTSLGGSVPPVNFTQPPPPLPSSFPQTIHRVQKDPVLVSGPVITAAPQQKPTSNPNAKGPLHRDFQEALDIIFPSDKKPEPQNAPNEQQQGPMDMNMMYSGMGPPGMGPQFGPPMGPPFGPPMGMMPPPQMNGPPGPPMMMGYDFNPPPMFAAPGPPQLYDRQVPLVPGSMTATNMPLQAAHQRSNTSSARQKQDNKSEMEDLAMLGIDAADVGACIH